MTTPVANIVEPSPTDRFRDPGTRTLLFVAAAGLLVVGAVLLVRGGLIPALLPVLAGTAGLLLRWTIMPVFVLALVCYLTVFPFGVPGLMASASNDSHFQILDLALVGGLLVFYAGQFRLLSLTHQAMPFDSSKSDRPKGELPIRRPGSLVSADEPTRLLMVAGVCLVVGQLAWWLVSELRIEPLQVPPVDLRRRTDEVDPASRFLLVFGLIGLVAIPVGLGFWFWRLARLSPAEGRMIVLDTAWSETRREGNRQAKWRAWAVARQRPPARLRTLSAAPPRPRPKRTWAEFYRACLTTGCVVLVAGAIAISAVVAVTRYFFMP